MGGSQSQNFVLELECPQLAPGQLPFGYVRSSTQTHRVADWEQPLELFIEDEDEVVVLTVYAAESRDRWKDGLARMHSEVYLPWSMMMEEQGSEQKRSWRLALDSDRILPDFFTDDRASRQEYKSHFQEAIARASTSEMPVITVTVTRSNPDQSAPSSMPPRAAAPVASSEPSASSAPPATWQQAPVGWQPPASGAWQANGVVSPRNGVAPGSSIPGGPVPPASEMELQHRTQRLERENRQLEEECRLLREENRRIREQPIPEQNVEAAFDQAVQDVQIHALQVQRLSEQLNASENKVMVLERQVLDLRNRQPDPNAAVVQSLREELNRSRDRNLRAIREYDAQMRLLEQELSDTKQALSQGVAVGDSNAENEVQELRIQLEVHQTEVDELKRRLQEADKSREQSGGVNEQLQSMEFRMQSWREQAEQIEQEKRQSEELNEKALREANAQISKLIDELDDKEAVIKGLQTTIEEMEQRQQQTTNTGESQDLELKDNEIGRLKQQLTIKDEQIAQLQTEWEGVAARAQSFVTASTRPATEPSLEAATAKARIEELSQQHADALARCEQLECDLKMAEVQNTVKATLISDLQRALQEKHRKDPEPARMTATA
mmetsp:Transcript_19277/g.48998  ORF Transcript_19277/g.48998 Transcript_19277/m.48998 type:complete len:610 (+) Transcript_19277:100-1929(+)